MQLQSDPTATEFWPECGTFLPRLFCLVFSFFIIFIIFTAQKQPLVNVGCFCAILETKTTGGILYGIVDQRWAA